ncbi:hypothetical protein MTO96_011520 [Rhipicephalus appendiculatus]
MRTEKHGARDGGAETGYNGLADRERDVYPFHMNKERRAGASLKARYRQRAENARKKRRRLNPAPRLGLQARRNVEETGAYRSEGAARPQRRGLVWRENENPGGRVVPAGRIGKRETPPEQQREMNGTKKGQAPEGCADVRRSVAVPSPTLLGRFLPRARRQIAVTP